MLKVRYTLQEPCLLTGWTDVEVEFDQLQARVGESVVVLDIAKPEPSDDYEWWCYDGVNLIPSGKPTPQPPMSTYISTIDAIDTAKARPVRIKRVWQGKDYFYDCLVTQSVKDQYVAGDISVGDYVLVHFDDTGEQVVTAKVFKSW